MGAVGWSRLQLGRHQVRHMMRQASLEAHVRAYDRQQACTADFAERNYPAVQPGSS
jgi:hypothetical protein